MQKDGMRVFGCLLETSSLPRHVLLATGKRSLVDRAVALLQAAFPRPRPAADVTAVRREASRSLRQTLSSDAHLDTVHPVPVHDSAVWLPPPAPAMELVCSSNDSDAMHSGPTSRHQPNQSLERHNQCIDAAGQTQP